jgi:hypothetical protein
VTREGTTDLILEPSGHDHVRQVVDLWFAFYSNKVLTDSNWTWRWFPWDRIIQHNGYATVGAVDASGQLEGLLSYTSQPTHIKVEFLATAPWNFGKAGLRKGVGSALLSNAIELSFLAGRGGALSLSSTPESETFYEHHDFVRTGQVDHEQLAIFDLPSSRASNFVDKYPPVKDDADES